MCWLPTSVKYANFTLYMVSPGGTNFRAPWPLRLVAEEKVGSFQRLFQRAFGEVPTFDLELHKSRDVRPRGSLCFLHPHAMKTVQRNGILWCKLLETQCPKRTPIVTRSYPSCGTYEAITFELSKPRHSIFMVCRIWAKLRNLDQVPQVKTGSCFTTEGILRRVAPRRNAEVHNGL